jgi:hypothetical protein
VVCSSGKVCTAGKCVYPPLAHDGCNAVAGVGCGGCVCESCVCAQDPYCCSTKWDAICADECAQCNTQDGCAAGPVNCPGCGGCACELCVCLLDPYCCTTRWDALCVTACEDCGTTCP